METEELMPPTPKVVHILSGGHSVVEPEEAAQAAERKVEVENVEHADAVTIFNDSRNVYRTWVRAFCGAVESYSFGASRQEAASVEAGLATRVDAVLRENKRRLATLSDLHAAALAENDNLPRALEEEVLGQRLAAVCAKWKQRATEAIEAFDDHFLNSHAPEDGGGDEMADADVDAILASALAAGDGGDGSHSASEIAVAAEESSESGTPSQEPRMVTPRSPRIPEPPKELLASPSREDQDAKLKALEEEAERLAAERKRVEEARNQDRKENVLLRVAEGLEMERAAKLAEAVQLAEQMTDAAPPPDHEDADEQAKHTSAHAREEIAEIAARNEGLVHKLTELEGLRAAAEGSGKSDVVAEHRKEIEKLKAEGETLAQRMLRLQEEREAAEKNVQSSARAELEQMRNQQKGRTKKKGQDVTDAFGKEDDVSGATHRAEIERMRDERANLTRLTATELADQATKAQQVEVSQHRVMEEISPLDSIKSRLAESERERIAALLAQHSEKPLEITLSTEVSSLLANIEQRLQTHEEEKASFQRRVQDMDERKQARSRQRDDQAAQRARREEEKRKEEEEFAKFQAERKRKLDEKKHFREVKERGERGDLPKHRVCVLGPKSGKTALVKRFIEGSFVETVDQSIDHTFDKPYSLRGGDCLLQVVDTTGMEEFSDFRKGWYSSCDGFLVVFDLTRKPKRTFKQLKAFGETLKAAKGKETLADIPIVLVGQKEDLIEKRKIKAGDALSFAKEWGAKYVETSAKTGENVAPAFDTVMSLIDAKNSIPSTTATPADAVQEQGAK